MDFIGTWHIYEMELWDEEYFNMESQAFIRFDNNYDGDFQFGLVSGDLDGRIIDFAGRKRIEFTFNGTDECDPCNGGGWIELKKEDRDIIEGEFRFHKGDASGFLAKRAKK